MTPPNREAMVYDLKVLKSLGVNMVRKHVSLTLKNKYLQNSKTGVGPVQFVESLMLLHSPSIG